jgi:hypothetical protein
MKRNFKKLNAEIGAEFDKYVAEHPKWAIKHIPSGAKVVIQIEGNSEFNVWSRRLAEVTRKPDQPMVLVYIKEFAPIRSRIVRAEVEAVA